MSSATKKGRRYNIEIGDRTHSVELLARRSDSVSFRLEGREYDVTIRPESLAVQSGPTRSSQTTLSNPSGNAAHSNSPNVHAPMPGLVVSISVEEGSEVQSGDNALVLEAMKMENAVTFTKSGTVASIHVKPGDQVEAGQVLIELA